MTGRAARDVTVYSVPRVVDVQVDGRADRGAMDVYCVDASKVAETVCSAPGKILASRVDDAVYSAPCEILTRDTKAEPEPCATGYEMAGAVKLCVESTCEESLGEYRNDDKEVKKCVSSSNYHVSDDVLYSVVDVQGDEVVQDVSGMIREEIGEKEPRGADVFGLGIAREVERRLGDYGMNKQPVLDVGAIGGGDTQEIRILQSGIHTEDNLELEHRQHGGREDRKWGSNR